MLSGTITGNVVGGTPPPIDSVGTKPLVWALMS
jgi:hypothetical protein